MFEKKIGEIRPNQLTTTYGPGSIMDAVNDSLTVLDLSYWNEKGFEILDFPCNQFANQAPGSGEEIASFCQARFGITFKQFAKIKVNGPEEEPLYTFLKDQKGGALGKKIKWNFTKFLIARDGTVVARYAPTTTPEKIDEDVAKLL